MDDVTEPKSLKICKFNLYSSCNGKCGREHITTVRTEKQAAIKRYMRSRGLCVAFALFGKCGHLDKFHRTHKSLKTIEIEIYPELYSNKPMPRNNEDLHRVIYAQNALIEQLGSKIDKLESAIKAVSIAIYKNNRHRPTKTDTLKEDKKTPPSVLPASEEKKELSIKFTDEEKKRNQELYWKGLEESNRKYENEKRQRQNEVEAAFNMGIVLASDESDDDDNAGRVYDFKPAKKHPSKALKRDKQIKPEEVIDEELALILSGRKLYPEDKPVVLDNLVCDIVNNPDVDLPPSELYRYNYDDDFEW